MYRFYNLFNLFYLYLDSLYYTYFLDNSLCNIKFEIGFEILFVEVSLPRNERDKGVSDMSQMTIHF